MIQALLLLASVSWGQSTAPVSGTDLIDSLEVQNLGTDVRQLQAGRYTQTGKPTFRNGFCFGDFTCQTTASSASSLDISTETVFSHSNITNTTYDVSVATVIFTASSGECVDIVSDVCGFNPTGTGVTCVNFLCDGAYCAGYSATVSVACNYMGPTDGAQRCFPASTTWRSVSSGQHQVSIRYKVTAGRQQYDSNNPPRIKVRNCR